MTGLRMAKASSQDIDAAIDLYRFLEAMANGLSAAHAIDDFCIAGYGDLLSRNADDVEFVMRAHEKGGLFRVVWGMLVLLDPRNEMVDPDCDCLAPHPKVVAAMNALNDALKVVCRAEKAEAELAAERERFNLLSQRCAQAEADRDAARTSFAELVRRVQLETGTFAQWREVDADEVADVMDVIADDHNKMLGALLVLRRLVVGKKLYWEQRRDEGAGETK